MKRITVILGLVSLLMVGCGEDFLKLTPMDTVSVDQLYKTEKDFADAVIGVYTVFRPQYQNRWLFGDLRGDDVWDELVKATARDFDQYTVTSDLGVFNSTWTNYYQIITRANEVINQLDGADPSIVRNKNRHMGEAKFLRALAYFDLVNIFGDVPKITVNPSASEALKIGRERVDVIYNEIIIPDLRDAESNLPPTYSGPDVGRATRGAARALLGKVYLYRKDFVNAENKLREVTTMGYALVPDFNRLWDYTLSEHHSEYIFDIEYEAGMNMGSNFTNNFAPRSTPLGQHYGIVGALNDNFNPRREFMNMWHPDDKRARVSVADGWYLADGTFVQLIPTSNSVATYTVKYMVRLTAQNDSPANWKVIRYADVLLMLAEAMNENGKTSEALGYLNQIRTRAGLESHANLSQAETRDMIALERRFELFAEGHRFFDLVRTGRAGQFLGPYGWQPHMTVFPIPLSQIEVMNNPAIFPQNPGYN